MTTTIMAYLDETPQTLVRERTSMEAGQPRIPLGERLRQLRELAQLSQNELARRARVPRPIISRVESGTQETMSLAYALRIAEVLGVSLDLLAGRRGPLA
jgi:DNA-binding XRE family transcriptional regulator